jgi:enterochelin esterase-like enzyme
VAYIDAHYRTTADRNSRGLVGHSMGGYGATRIGMMHPDVFGALYIMSPWGFSARGAGWSTAENDQALEAVKTPADSAKLLFGLRAQLASAAAWFSRTLAFDRARAGRYQWLSEPSGRR